VTFAFELTELGKITGASFREDVQDLVKTWLQSTGKKKRVFYNYSYMWKRDYVYAVFALQIPLPLANSMAK